MKPQVCIILTCTIDANNVVMMERSETNLRYEDYKVAFKKWLMNENVTQIIFVENSNYDLSEFRTMYSQFGAGKLVEFLSYDGQNFPRQLGKGFGEAKALEFVVLNSDLFSKNVKFIKVNGRYYVTNIARFILHFGSVEKDVMADLTNSLRWSDSRLFGGSKNFICEYLIQQVKKTNDTNGLFFEHLLARAINKALADGLEWISIPCVFLIDGVSGTTGRAYKQTLFGVLLKNIFLKIKNKILIY
jgi:hypothetical protein